MKPEQQDDLLQAMEEASVLSADDPIRREVETRIVEAGAWAEEKWLEILQEDEQYRLDLQRVDPPAGLNKRLLAIPDQIPLTRIARPRWKVPTAVAAVAAGIVFAVVTMLNPQGESTDQRLNTVAVLAIGNHQNIDYVSVNSDDDATVSSHLSKLVSFKVRMPDMKNKLSLRGGRKCGLGTHEVVVSKWEKDGKKYSLYQFCAKDFGLPDRVLKRIVSPNSPSVAGQSVLFWTEDHCAFALVADKPELLLEIQDTL